MTRTEYVDGGLPYTYTSRNGTTFRSTRGLGGGVTIKRVKRVGLRARVKTSVREGLFIADCMEFAAMHAIQVHPTLNGFQGYDCLAINL